MASRSLLALAEDEVLESIYQASQAVPAVFCAGGTLGRLPLRLAVESAGGPCARIVDLPGEEALAALLAECEPAKLGKGSKTVLDESYRSVLALPASRLFTQHFEAAHLSGVLAAVGCMLLPAAGPLSARLHALNAYSKGGFFKPHCDTPRGDPGFVGSLVVCLPVAHSGGALRGALRVAHSGHSGHSVNYTWGAGAVAWERQPAGRQSRCAR
ncbi:hypothetical protein ABPG75_008816 [Micractinium tetrahymenae]